MDHLARVQKAVDFIEDNLCEELPIEQIAKVAAFSMWHFQKVFGAAVGESVKEYVRKRRLTSAMAALVSTDRRIIDIALDHQFESQESFTRAFKAMFGRNPGECRKLGASALPSLRKPRITMEYLDHLYGGMTMKPTFVTTKAKHVIGMSTHFISVTSPDKNNHMLLPQLWRIYLQRAGEIKHRIGPGDVGLCEPLLAEVKGHPDEYFYMAGTEVERIEDVPAGMTAKTIPAGRFAVFTHKGQIDKIEHTMRYIFGSWLPRSGEELREAADLEVYDHRFKYGSDDSELDIYIPVK